MADHTSETTEAADPDPIEALRTFPLPSQSRTGEENYRAILGWLYAGPRTIAGLIIDLSTPHPPHASAAPDPVERTG